MSDLYFSEREYGESPRNNETINLHVWKGIQAKVHSLISDGSFGVNYPELCREYSVPVGTDVESFNNVMQAEIPALADYYEAINNKRDPWGDYEKDEEPPTTSVILDMIEFCWRNVSKPIHTRYHDYYSHHHLKFDVEEGRRDFCKSINRLFRRNGLAYELKHSGKVERRISAVLQNILNSSLHTGDADLDKMLATAQEKILNHRTELQREALDSLWDAWERLKTVYDPRGNKKEGITSLLNMVAGDESLKFREDLEKEAKELTNIGNSFQIRHSEVGKEKIHTSSHVEYLFHRLFSIIHLIIKTRNLAKTN